jgi:hypothetical protein
VVLHDLPNRNADSPKRARRPFRRLADDVRFRKLRLFPRVRPDDAVRLSAVAARAPPWRAVGAILALGVVARIAIWGGTRDHIVYELIYQSAFIAGAALSLSVAIRVVRRDGGLLWWGVIFVFCLIVMHFATKPFFAVYLGSGANDRAYTGSFYAIFSQSTGGVLIIAAGLQILLVILATAIGRTTLDSETDPLTSIANRRGFDRQNCAGLVQRVRAVANAACRTSPATSGRTPAS